MGWITLDKEESRTFYDVLQEIREGSPRATAVVAAAFVEDHLTQVIKRHLVRTPVNRAKNPIEDMFAAGGPLGDFATKIDFAYLTSKISKQACVELHVICGIRNEFAYKMETSNFDDGAISARCAELKRWKEIKIKLRAGDGKKKGCVSLAIGTSADVNEPGAAPVDLLAYDKVVSPRDRFVAACQFYIAAFVIAINGANNVSKPSV